MDPEDTSLNAVVNLHEGIVMRSSNQIMKECKNYKGEVTFVRKDNPSKTADAKNIIALIGLEAAKGTELQILVQGRDEEAKTLAQRLYSGVTSKNSYALDFDSQQKPL